MSAKRALVVDDSKSARLFLSRMLEKYSIEVDGAESAEQAIEYLTHHRPPDVIFLDHLMPGMDGLQALAAIKDNPSTATIPVLMYTSQEGELYLGQARALGAVGVLPKQIRPAEVSKVLHQLRLLPERRSERVLAQRPTAAAAVSVVSEERTHMAGARPLTDDRLRAELAELRRALLTTLDGQASRIKAELHASLEQALARGALAAPPAVRPVRWGWVVAAVAAILAGESLYVAHHEAVERRALAAEMARLDAAIRSGSGAGSVPQPDPARDAAAPLGAPASSPPIVETVPYGEAPLGGPRLDVLRRLFDRLAADGYHGVVAIRIFSGRFCLSADAAGGYALAAPGLPYSQCTLASAGAGAAVSTPGDVPVGFADLVSSFRAATHGAVAVRVERGDPASTVVAYPPVTDSLTAGEWNSAAGANNRIEIRLR